MSGPTGRPARQGHQVLIDAQGWAGPFKAQSARINDVSTNSFWYVFFPDTAIRTVNLLSGTAVVFAWLMLLAAGFLIRRRTGIDYPAVQVGAAMVVAYILLGRVHSPQYGLWIAPFLVVLAVPLLWQAFFAVSNIFLWLEWSWLLGSPSWTMQVAIGMSWVALCALTIVFLLRPDPGTEFDSRGGFTGAGNQKKHGGATQAVSI
jgi:hypothetical protein